MFLSQTAILNFTVSVNTDFWSGANDLGNTGIWAWMDGTPFDFKDWDTEQPKNTSGNDCGTIIMQGGKWIADDCFKEKPFVCLVKALEATTAIPITTTTTLKPKPTKCPVSYTYYNATEFCYVIFGNETWVNAENRCEIDGAHLASIHDITESLFIAHMAFPDNTVPHLWMGLYTEDKNAHWQWTDKTSFDYPSWQPGQPDSPGIENCGVLWNNGNFNNLDCAFMTKYVCKILPS
uniref:C-type lectin domain-containing protein n=1 Tax=Panagrolaimus davidi TaxID=227884 RepID=A0A914R771_9BILA